MSRKNVAARMISCLFLATGQAVAMPAFAMSLLETYALAQGHDPAFQAAKADRAVLEADVTVAKLAYFPTANAAYGQDTNENKTRTTVQIAQPVLDLEKFALMRSAQPRAVLAETSFRMREQDLAAKVLGVVSELIKARETLIFSEEQIRALTEQEHRSRRRFELGQGTVTETSTARVRLDQALAKRRQLEAQKVIVEKQFIALTGVRPPESGFGFRAEPASIELDSLLQLIDKAYAGNAKVIEARTQERLAELERQRIMAGYLPQVNAIARSTRYDGETTNYTGLQFAIPLGVSAANFANQYKASVQIERAREVKRDVEETEKLEIERLWSLVGAGLAELKIRKSAIAAAELSAQGNLKSYEGGVAPAVDVINAILTVFETKQDYLNTLVQTADHYLKLQLTAADHPIEALGRVQTVLLDSVSP